MLAAGALGPICVDTKVLLAYLDIRLVTEVGHDIHACEAGVSPGIGVKWADPHQPMNTPLGFESSVCAITFDRECG